ncbi:MAG: hypothetical protein ACRDT4_25045 [Micromonosporaceae bacterium]
MGGVPRRLHERLVQLVDLGAPAAVAWVCDTAGEERNASQGEADATEPAGALRSG